MPSVSDDLPDITTCVACAASEMQPLADLGVVPVHSGATFATFAEATAAPSAPMELAVCPACNHVYNVRFIPSLLNYDEDYDNSLHHSRTFQSYSSELAGRLSRHYDLEEKHVVELGSGKGHFLIDLCRSGRATGTGYDPSYDGTVRDERVTFVRDFMPWDEAPAFDFFVSRHVLEHLVEPHEFLLKLRATCATRPVAGYLEVPDAVYDFDRSPWNCHYPHVSYFSATSLSRLAIRAGFTIRQLIRSFEGQYLAIELGVNMVSPDEMTFGGMGVQRERRILDKFGSEYKALIDTWQAMLRSTGYERCAVWGAGAKGLGFLGAVDPDGKIGAVVDLNPAKHGRYLPVSGHRISRPADLRERDIKTVILTNPVYRGEVQHALDELGVAAEVLLAH